MILRTTTPRPSRPNPSAENSGTATLRLCILTGLFLLGCQEQSPAPSTGSMEPPPVPVYTTEVALHGTARNVTTVGSLRSPRTTVVAAEISGVLRRLDAPEGGEVARGQVIARIDDAEARAALTVAEARNENAKSTFARIEPLVEGGVLPQQQLDQARAELNTSEGLLEEVRTRLGKTTVRAPFSGLVGIQTAQVGQYLSSGDAIIELTRIDPLELVFNVPEEMATEVRIGQSVEARLGRCGEPFEAIVQARNPTLDQSTRTLAVQARVPNPEQRLAPGMSARVRLQVAAAVRKPAIPREALVAQGTGYVVWVVEESGQVRPQPVEPGRFLPDLVEIESGVETGTQVVVAGHQKLRPGARVATQPWQATVNPNLARGTSETDCFGPDEVVEEVPTDVTGASS